MVSRQRRVILIHNIVAPYRLPLFQRLSESPGVDLKVYFLRESAKHRRWRIDGSYQFEHRILPGIELSFKGHDVFSYVINPTAPFELLETEYDVVITSGWLDFACQIAFFISKTRRKPYVLWAESTINEPSWRRTVSLPLVKLMVRGADACIACGTRSTEYLIQLGAPEERIFIAPNSVDIDHFRSGSTLSREERTLFKRKLGVGGRKVILYTGRLIGCKGLRYLIEAYGRLREERADVSLLIAGDGRQEKELKNLCERANTRDIHFVGFIDADTLPTYYGISDLFVLPSTQEVWGMVINEAMACGLPVITTDRVGASVDLVENGVNGYIVEAGNTTQLFEAMKKVMEDPILRVRLAEASRRRILRFTPEASVEGFLSAIQYAMTRQR